VSRRASSVRRPRRRMRLSATTGSRVLAAPDSGPDRGEMRAADGALESILDAISDSRRKTIRHMRRWIPNSHHRCHHEAWCGCRERRIELWQQQHRR
jgi:hypothetical protein